MFSLQLSCSQDQAEMIAAELWDWGTIAISESEAGGQIRLLAGFATDDKREELLNRFSALSPEWEHDETDWELETRQAWPPRAIGQRIFLAPHWRSEQTPVGRVRLIHNPGSASGTGEHPCTQLALEALENLVAHGSRVVDVGTGSGILAIAAVLLGATHAMALDTDWDSLLTARENCQLNALAPLLAAGSAECIRDGYADITVANISGTVLLSILDELLRITQAEGTLVLTGFTEGEAATFLRMFPQAVESSTNEWRCLVIPLSSTASLASPV